MLTKLLDLQRNHGKEKYRLDYRCNKVVFIGKVDTTTFFTPDKLTPIDYIDSNSIALPNFPKIKTEAQYRNMRMGIEVKSPPGNEERFYQISLYSAWLENGKTHLRSLYIYTQGDPIFADSPRSKIFDELFSIKKDTQRYPIFSTKLFKKNAYTLQVSTTNYYVADIKTEKGEDETFFYSEKSGVLNPPIEIRILSISPDLYRYYTSNDHGYFTDGEFMWLKEPQLTHSNVHNGIGIVGAVATAQKQILLPAFEGEKNVFPK